MKCSNDEENKELIGDIKNETVHEIWHGEKMNKIREMHNKKNGFLNSEICRKCYLPRKVKSEFYTIEDRKIEIKNYTKRSQIVGS